MVFFERWNVPEANATAFLDYYENVILGAYRYVQGFAGALIVKRGAWWEAGEPRKAAIPHFGMRTGEVQTNTSINLEVLIQHEYTHAALIMFDRGARLDGFLAEWMAGWERLQPEWRRRHPDARQPDEALSRDFFSLSSNHWDVTYDVIRAITPAALAARTDLP